MHTINEFMSIDTIHLYVELLKRKNVMKVSVSVKKKEDENLAQFCLYLYFHFISLNIYTLTTKNFIHLIHLHFLLILFPFYFCSHLHFITSMTINRMIPS